MLGRASVWLVGGLEDFFSWYGGKVATHPLKAVTGCVLLTGVALIGMLRYTTENNAFKLWIPDNSDFVANYAWLEQNSPPDIRFNSLILAAEGDVLTPEALAYLANLHRKVASLVTSSSGLTWGEVCYTAPVRREGAPPPQCEGNPFLEPCYPDQWCNYIEDSSRPECLETSLLELWGYNFDYSTLTREAILQKVNSPNLTSTVTGNPLEVHNLLGSWKEDESGRLAAAEATYVQWFGRVDTSAIKEDEVSDMGTGEIVDTASLEWEEALRDLLMEERSGLPAGLTSYINVARGYSDIAGDTIKSDALMMPIGFLIVFVYVTIMLGKFNCIQQRGMLALAGLGAIGLTVGFTYGSCSAMGLFYGPMHNIVPFLLLGIGIDDMFVIMQCYDNLPPHQRSGDIPTTVSLTMRHAGVAITVTSVTDFMVFAIGSSTVLPALRSFCLWCGVGILAVYFFQATFFVACLSLDCRRLSSRRNGLCPCYRHQEPTLAAAEGKQAEAEGAAAEAPSLAQRCFHVVGGWVLSPPGVVVVLGVAAAFLSGGVYGATQLQQEFDPTWFLPPSSYLRQWFEANSRYFPTDGERVTVYLTELDWSGGDLQAIQKLGRDLEKATDIIQSVDSWWLPYSTFMNLLDLPVPDTQLTDQQFSETLTQFLFSPLGLRYTPNFKFRSPNLTCGEAAPALLLSTITFTHVSFQGRGEHIPALNKVKSIIADCQFSGNVFALTQEYSNWETDEVITKELVRNLGIALACVFLTTLLLLANFLGSLMVLLCVAIVLVDLCGYMHFWGITIDVVSAVNVIIAIGLCVDYSVHICHAFLTVSGTKKQRALAAMVNMGPAVLNGGLSTLIAFILLLSSDSHVFSSFFKIFLLVVLFGVWHGLIFLPVLLSLLGPAAYLGASSHSTEEQQQGHNKIKDNEQQQGHNKIEDKEQQGPDKDKDEEAQEERL